MTVRLCLVRVKAFPENIPSFGNAIFRKGKCFHVFGCISKKFPKNIFWCLEKKEKTNLEKYGQNPDWRSTLDWVWCTASLREIAIDGAISRSVNRDLAKHRADCNRREGEIAIDGAISRSVDRDLAKHHTDRDWREREIAMDGARSRLTTLVLANGAAWSSARVNGAD